MHRQLVQRLEEIGGIYFHIICSVMVERDGPWNVHALSYQTCQYLCAHQRDLIRGEERRRSKTTHRLVLRRWRIHFYQRAVI